MFQTFYYTNRTKESSYRRTKPRYTEVEFYVTKYFFYFHIYLQNYISRNVYLSVNRKNIKMLLALKLNLPQNPVDSHEIWYTLSWINLWYASLNVFQLTWIMSLQYLVKLSVAFGKRTAIGTVKPKNTPNVFCHIVYKTRPILQKFCTYCPEYICRPVATLGQEEAVASSFFDPLGKYRTTCQSMV